MNTLIIERVRALQNDAGELDPRDVLKDARNPDSPLHDQFEWDDAKCGEAYRLDQARSLIRSIRLVVTEDKHQLQAIAYVRNPDKPEGEAGYVSTAVIRNNKETARAAVCRELQFAENALQRAYAVADAVGLSHEVAQLLAAIRNVRSAA